MQETEDTNDLWALYNLVEPHDKVYARTSRKIKKENSDGVVTGVTVKKFNLEIEVTKVDYAPDDASIRIAGQVLTDCEDISLGQYHTIELGVNDTVRLTKIDWDYSARRVLIEATDPKKSAEVGAVLMELGGANLYLLCGSLIKSCGRVQGKVVKANTRNVAFGKTDKAKLKYYEMLAAALNTSFDLTKIRCIILAGKPEVYDDFYEWLFAEQRKGITKGLFIRAGSSGCQATDLEGLLSNEQVSRKLADTRAVCEFQAIQNFHKMKNQDPLRVTYGLAGVYTAGNLGAIDSLIISDRLFKSSNLKVRKYFSELAQQLEHLKAKIIIVSYRGIASHSIQALSDVAAVLRYPVYELEEVDLSCVPRELVP
ncbi:putative pelota protein [Gregarina niphandrodes]|uniref:Eukaryotic peptide chain release factor subunit 1 n=1 Tax=Gregarina niphandrodes TaxID=110365 RepID=A0A023B7L6_GRENI|nr:putative pelota protein [Gregarina niphandrodes]EZG67510.1 putative pelota protein [Gregarina niphandrodes]|eukprot:XP_011130225.1 putative pelota protein [Gregarina niphandrodes]